MKSHQVKTNIVKYTKVRQKIIEAWMLIEMYVGTANANVTQQDKIE